MAPKRGAKASPSVPVPPEAKPEQKRTRRIGAKSTIVPPISKTVPHGMTLKDMVMKRETNVFLNVRAAKCYQCEQDTHNQEVDRDDEAYVYWSKVENNAAGLLVPMGCECGHCRDTRVRYYTTLKGDKTVKPTKEDIKEDRAKNPEQDAKWSRLRADRASGRLEYTSERVNLKHTVEKYDKNYNKGFVKGAFYEFSNYVSQFSIPGKTREEQVEYIFRQKGCKCGHGENGKYGVFATTLPAGADYAFEFGVEHGLEHKEQEKFGTAEDARDAFVEATVGSSGATFADILPNPNQAAPQACSPVQSSPLSHNQLESRSPDNDVLEGKLDLLRRAAQQRSISPPPVSEASHGAVSVKTLPYDAKLHAPPRAVPALPSVWPTGSSHWDTSSHVSCLTYSIDPNGEETVVQTGKTRRPPLPAGVPGIIEGGRRTHDDVDEEFTAEVLWNKRYRPRGF